MPSQNPRVVPGGFVSGEQLVGQQETAAQEENQRYHHRCGKRPRTVSDPPHPHVKTEAGLNRTKFQKRGTHQESDFSNSIFPHPTATNQWQTVHNLEWWLSRGGHSQENQYSGRPTETAEQYFGRLKAILQGLNAVEIDRMRAERWVSLHWYFPRFVGEETVWRTCVMREYMEMLVARGDAEDLAQETSRDQAIKEEVG